MEAKIIRNPFSKNYQIMIDVKNNTTPAIGQEPQEFYIREPYTTDYLKITVSRLNNKPTP